MNNNVIGNEFTDVKNPGTPFTVNGYNEPRTIRNGSIVHGNYVTNSSEPGISWDPSIDDHTIPDSYYLTARPDWFEDLDWPCFGGDLMPGNTKRSPAEVRYWTMLHPEISPSNLQANVQGNDVVLTWDNNSVNDVDFIICKSTDNTDYHRVGETADVTYTNTVQGSGQYYYYVRARNYLGGKDGDEQGGESDPSEIIEVDVP